MGKQNRCKKSPTGAHCWQASYGSNGLIHRACRYCPEEDKVGQITKLSPHRNGTHKVHREYELRKYEIIEEFKAQEAFGTDGCIARTAKICDVPASTLASILDLWKVRSSRFGRSRVFNDDV